MNKILNHNQKAGEFEVSMNKIPSSLYALAITLFISLTLTGCAPTKIVMPPLKHHEDIGLHIAKTAHIYWIPGRLIASEKQKVYMGSTGGGSGLAVLLVNAVEATIDHHQRKNHPSEYAYEYGKADEAVFITSLRDILAQQNVFKNVELTTDLNKVQAKDVLIKVYFKTARVIDLVDIKLSVVLSIKSGSRPVYERTYLAQNDPYHISKAKTFVERKTEASQKLLTEIIHGIKQWHEENKQ
jgi:hypothetical protein